MNFAKKILISICKTVFRIPLVDRFLIIFMIIIFVYMAYHLLSGRMVSEEVSTVNVIIRTSAAGIFGYFISSNFGKENDVSITQNIDSRGVILPSGNTDGEGGLRAQNQIGFLLPAEGNQRERTGENFGENTHEKGRSRAQIYLVSIIGLLSLITLIFTRDIQSTAPEMTAITSQLRDFISACIGFLISSGKAVSD